MSHRPRRIEHAQLDASFLWTMVIVLIGCILLVTCGVVLKIIAHRREIRRKLREYGIVLGDASMAPNYAKRRETDPLVKIQKRMRIHSAQPRRPSSNSRRLNNSRQERLSNLPRLADVSPYGLSPTSAHKRHGSGSRGSRRSKRRDSRRSRNSRHSARPGGRPKLEAIGLRHNNYLI